MLTALSKAEGPFDKPMFLSKIEGLTALSKFESRGFDSSFPDGCFMASYKDIKREYTDFSHKGDPLQIPFLD